MSSNNSQNSQNIANAENIDTNGVGVRRGRLVHARPAHQHTVYSAEQMREQIFGPTQAYIIKQVSLANAVFKYCKLQNTRKCCWHLKLVININVGEMRFTKDTVEQVSSNPDIPNLVDDMQNNKYHLDNQNGTVNIVGYFYQLPHINTKTSPEEAVDLVCPQLQKFVAKHLVIPSTVAATDRAFKMLKQQDSHYRQNTDVATMEMKLFIKQNLDKI